MKHILLIALLFLFGCATHGSPRDVGPVQERVTLADRCADVTLSARQGAKHATVCQVR